METITLGGKARPVNEPVFRQLRQIVSLYNQLATATSSTDTTALMQALLSVFFEQDSIRLNRVKPDELMAFVSAIPALAGLTPSTTPTTETGDGWGDTYAHLTAYFGWEYDYIDNHMTLSRLNELSPYLKNNPPTHQLVAAYLGYVYKPPGNSVHHFFKSLLAQAGK